MRTTHAHPAVEQQRHQVHAVKALPSSSVAPHRGLFTSPVIEQCSEAELREEHVLLEHLLRSCLDICARCSGQAEVLGLQTLPPEAVSLVDPPDQLWLVWLRSRTPAWQGHPEEAQEVQALVSLRGQELCLLFL